MNGSHGNQSKFEQERRVCKCICAKIKCICANDHSPFPWSPPRPRPLRLAPQAPEFGPFEFCIWRQLCPFPEVHCWPPAPPPAPRLPQFGYLAEGDYAQCLGPLCQRDTIVMLVATLLRAAYAMLK